MHHVKKMAAVAGRGVFIVAAKRTPFGVFGGKLKNLSATELSAVASSAALESGGVRPDLVDSVVIGNVAQVMDCVYMHRSITEGRTPLSVICPGRSSQPNPAR